MKKNFLQIERYRTPNFKSIIEITPRNKNYVIFKAIDTILKKENKQWNWVLKRWNISEITLKTYLSGQENISLRSIEAISNAMKPFIESPRTLMNGEFPNLRYSKQFKLNLNFIIRKYGITQSEIARYTGVDRSGISNIVHDKTCQIGSDKVVLIYNFLVSRGVPLRSPLDLIYFPSWGEEPGHFLKFKPRHNHVFKYHSSMRPMQKI